MSIRLPVLCHLLIPDTQPEFPDVQVFTASGQQTTPDVQREAGM